MRLTGGALKGRTLRAPAGMATRPTSDRVREALFSILGDVTDLAVLDVCAGAGTLGLEALSRGAASAVFVEHAKPARDAITRNLAELGLTGRGRLHHGAAPQALTALGEGGEAFSLIFLDPPYHAPVLGEAVEAIAAGGLLRPGGVLVAEMDRDDALPAALGGLVLDETRRYGRTVLSFLTR